jgi:hypothetical protein
LNRGKVARIALKKASPAAARHAQPSRSVEAAPKHSDVRQGELLDPFGQDD